MCMMNNNNTQFNLLYIATKTSKSDPQNATTFSALVPVTVMVDYNFVRRLPYIMCCNAAKTESKSPA